MTRIPHTATRSDGRYCPGGGAPRSVRLSDEEDAVLVRAAAAAGLTVSEYVRRVLAGVIGDWPREGDR